MGKSLVSYFLTLGVENKLSERLASTCQWNGLPYSQTDLVAVLANRSPNLNPRP